MGNFHISNIIKGTIFAIGGWSLFFGITGYFNLRDLNPLYLMIIGVLIIFISVKFDFNKKE